VQTPIGQKILQISLEESGFNFLNSVLEELSNYTNGSYCFLGILKDIDSETVLGILANEGKILDEPFEYCMSEQPCRLVYNNQILNIPCDVQKDFLRKKSSGLESFIGFPLSHPTKGIVAHFASYSATPDQFNQISMDCMKLVQSLVAREIVSIIDKYSLEEIESKAVSWRQAALTDTLTRCMNRRALESDWMSSWQIGHHFGSLAILDIDHFKKINDDYGHEVGDLCLQRFSKTVMKNTDEEVIKFYRLGGEEFCILAPDLHAQGLEKHIANIKFALIQSLEGQSELPNFTFSGGISEYSSNDLACWLRSADASLYQAKQAGRDRVLIAETT